MVEGMVVATSRSPGESYTDYCTAMSKISRGDAEVKYADRPDMPYFWGRQNLLKPEERAIGFAYTFLGIRIQCAQCHKHPFDQWSKHDFDDFRNFFPATPSTRFSQNGAQQGDKQAQEEYQKIVKDLGLSDSELRGNQLKNKFNDLMMKDGKTVPFAEIGAFQVKANNNQPRGNKKLLGEGPTSPIGRVLGGEEIDLTKVHDARQPLMDWLKNPSNPFFAKSFVNRAWANYFNVGIVEPPDDMSLANPPSNRGLLEYLAKGFIEHNFDMKWVHRTIVNSRTYQLSWQPNETNAKDEKNFARSVPRRLPAEAAVDALATAVASDEKAATYLTKLDGRAIAVPGASAARANQGKGDTGFALQVFGRSTRESNCDCDRSMEASLLQTVFLQNDNTVLTALEGGRGSWIEQITAKPAAKDSSARGSGERRGAGADLAQLKQRLEQLKKNGKPEQVQRAEERIAELEKAAGGSKDAGAGAAAPTLAIDEPTLVRQAYLRTLCRLPTPEEVDRCTQFLAQSESPIAGAKGLLWSLINTKEFIVNH
jgi:Protein of unknown function (DUF1553)/Protein of unknown function (DUF1549)